MGYPGTGAKFVDGVLDSPCKVCGGVITTANAVYAGYILRRLCKDCSNKENKVRQARYRDKIRKSGRIKDIVLQYMHGISLEQYTEMLTKQNGVCAICHEVNTDGRALAVDHDHQTGKIRELLCLRCNTTLGQYDDNMFLIMELINYLTKHTEI
jgi:hypothetical protein